MSGVAYQKIESSAPRVVLRRIAEPGKPSQYFVDCYVSGSKSGAPRASEHPSELVNRGSEITETFPGQGEITHSPIRCAQTESLSRAVVRECIRRGVGAVVGQNVGPLKTPEQLLNFCIGIDVYLEPFTSARSLAPLDACSI
jgi:hypothetical protein